MPAVSFQAISKTFATPKGPFQALNQVSLDIEQGEFFGLLGPNGAGKTTLISILAGLTSATGGRVLVKGHDVQTDYQAARRALGVVPQELVFDPFFSVRDALRVLETEGVLTIHPRSGIQFVKPGLELTRSTYQFRGILERAAVAVFAETADEEQLAELEDRHLRAMARLETEGLSEDIKAELEALEALLHNAIIGSLNKAGRRTGLKAFQDSYNRLGFFPEAGSKLWQAMIDLGLGRGGDEGCQRDAHAQRHVAPVEDGQCREQRQHSDEGPDQRRQPDPLVAA